MPNEIIDTIDIIDALRFCVMFKTEKNNVHCNDCPFNDTRECEKVLLESVLEVIKCKNKEYEALAIDEERAHQYCKNVCEPKYKAELKRLQEDNLVLSQKRTTFAERIKIVHVARNAAYKELAERVKGYFNPDSSNEFFEWLDKEVESLQVKTDLPNCGSGVIKCGSGVIKCGSGVIEESLPQTKGLRPCYVGARKALFHKWEKKQTASPLGGMLEFTVALVEFENGSIETRNPQHIRFADSAGLFKQFAFDEEREAKT